MATTPVFLPREFHGLYSPWGCKELDTTWQPTPVFLPGESQGRGSLVGCCLWGRTESDTTEATQQQQQQQQSHFCLHYLLVILRLLS